MEVIVSAAVSSDGYLDDCTPRRLVLSCAEDWAEVHRLRAWCDAILVGAETVRRDNPSLVIRDAGLRIWREWLGMKPDLTKVTVTAGGSLDAGARFFTEGPGAEKIVVTVPAVRRGLEERLPSGVRVVALEEITAGGILDALEGFGVRSLMVEGGARTIGMFLDAGVVDSLRLAVSPAAVGDTRAPRFPEFGRLPFEGRAAKVVRRVGDMEVYEYAFRPASDGLTLTDRRRLLRAVNPPHAEGRPGAWHFRAFCVVSYTREQEPYSCIRRGMLWSDSNGSSGGKARHQRRPETPGRKGRPHRHSRTGGGADRRICGALRLCGSSRHLFAQYRHRRCGCGRYDTGGGFLRSGRAASRPPVAAVRLLSLRRRGVRRFRR